MSRHRLADDRVVQIKRAKLRHLTQQQQQQQLHTTYHELAPFEHFHYGDDDVPDHADEAQEPSDGEEWWQTVENLMALDVAAEVSESEREGNHHLTMQPVEPAADLDDNLTSPTSSRGRKRSPGYAIVESAQLKVMRSD